MKLNVHVSTFICYMFTSFHYSNVNAIKFREIMVIK